MKKDTVVDQTDWRCEEKCSLEWVQCMDTEDYASICKTREQSCLEQCSAEQR